MISDKRKYKNQKPGNARQRLSIEFQNGKIIIEGRTFNQRWRQLGLTLERVGLTKFGSQSLPVGITILDEEDLSLTMSKLGRFGGLSLDKGSLWSFIKKSRSYCFLPSWLIGDHWSENKTRNECNKQQGN